ncbi:MAG: hypothetical protein FJ222_10000 [Lentisphaerae bacterium]|nr:hypothetical protein [Lentisphaerota bacterium]
MKNSRISLALVILALAAIGCRAVGPERIWDDSAAAEPLPGGRLQALVENTRCYASLPRIAHRPNFSIIPVTEPKYRKTFFWILDGEQKVGLINQFFGEIEMFRFFPPAGGVRVEYAMPAFHGWETLQGPRISIVPQGTWSGKGEMTGMETGGETLRLCYRETLSDTSDLIHRFTLRFDPMLGYIWDCTFDMRTDTPRLFEYSNLLPNGVGDSRDARKRYQKCLWTRQDGALCAMYQNPRSMMQTFGREWTDIPEDGGFVGFVAEPDINPFLEIIRSAPATTFVTCSVWYDQHVKALPPTKTGDDGRYHVTAAYRFLSLPLPVAKELEDAARTMPPDSKREGPMGFRQGVVNDFETLVPSGTLYNGCIWGHSAKHDSTIGHSGTHSLRLHGGESARPVHGGPLLHVTAGARYRLSVWARTRGVTEPGARLRLQKKLDSPDARESKALTGDTDWTRLEIEFEPAEGEAFAVPGLTVEGAGIAWFDDIELVEIPR